VIKQSFNYTLNKGGILAPREGKLDLKRGLELKAYAPEIEKREMKNIPKEQHYS